MQLLRCIGFLPGRRGYAPDAHTRVQEGRGYRRRHGWADLKGKSVDERAHALIGLARPDFRETLERAAHEKGLRPAAARGAAGS